MVMTTTVIADEIYHNDDGEGAEDDDQEDKVIDDGNDDNDDVCDNNMAVMKMTLVVVATVYSECKCWIIVFNPQIYNMTALQARFFHCWKLIIYLMVKVGGWSLFQAYLQMLSRNIGVW